MKNTIKNAPAPKTAAQPPKGKALAAPTRVGPPAPRTPAATPAATAPVPPKGKGKAPANGILSALASAVPADLLREIEASKAEIAKLSAQLTKATSRGPALLTPEDAAASAEWLDDPNDWRAPYLGYIVNIARFSFDRDDRIVIHSQHRAMPHLIGLPLDSAKQGATARNAGKIAVYSAKRVDGRWEADSANFLDQDEFDAAYVG